MSSSTPGIKQLLCTVPVVKAVLGYDITKEELGDERTQIYEDGVIDNLAESEPEAYEMIRRFFSYLPANVWQLPPRGEIPGRFATARGGAAFRRFLRQKRRAPTTHTPCLGYVLDPASLFEISPLYGRSRITALARVNGYPVSVMAHNPRFLGSSMDVDAGQKAIRFLQKMHPPSSTTARPNQEAPPSYLLFGAGRTAICTWAVKNESIPPLVHPLGVKPGRKAILMVAS